MAGKRTVKLTANFERNLQNIEQFLDEAGAAGSFDELLDELGDTVIPNLERFPAMGRLFLARPVRSVEVSNGLDALQAQCKALSADGLGGELREYLLPHYLMLYWATETELYLLSIRHHRQLSFDFESLWEC